MGSHWSHWKVKSSLCPLAVLNGGSIISFTFPYIFLLVDCFEWALIGHIEKCRVHSVFWQFQMGGGSIVSFTFPYIFLLVDCFKWALIGHIEKWRVHSVLWQFQMGGQIYPPGVNLKIWACFKFCSCFTDFSLYFPISWLFQMGSHWSHWKVKCSLCPLAVSNGGQIYPPGVNLKMWACFKFCFKFFSCFTELFHFYK